MASLPSPNSHTSRQRQPWDQASNVDGSIPNFSSLYQAFKQQCATNSSQPHYMKFVSSKSKETLLIIPGTPGRAEMAFPLIMAFIERFNIISIDYPVWATTVADVLAFIDSVLVQEHQQQVHILGGSYGGMIAQCFVRRFPHKVKTLILSHAGVPDKAWVKYFLPLKRFTACLPLLILHALSRLGAPLYFLKAGRQRPFWLQFYGNIIASLRKDDYVNRINIWLDLCQNYQFHPHELDAWQGKILIVESDNDFVFQHHNRETLRSLYPQAHIATYHTAHSTTMVDYHSYVRDIENILAN